MPAFYLTGVSANEDDHSGIRLLQCQLQEIVSVTCNHEQAVRGGIGEGFAIVRPHRQHFPQLNDFVAFAAENASDLRRDVVVEEKSHTASGGLIWRATSASISGR